MGPVSKCSILSKVKEGENFNHKNTCSISRIELKLHFVQNVEPDAVCPVVAIAKTEDWAKGGVLKPALGI